MIFNSDKRHLHEALTRWNYFPNQKEGTWELPPCVSSKSFTPEISEMLAECRKRSEGYDLVEYRATRYNNVPRILSLVHPKAHSDVVKCFIENWEHLESLYTNEFSIIRPNQHNDGRAFIMNYEKYDDKVTNLLDLSFAKKFRVHTDISNFFGSVYSHSFEWALRGFKNTKDNLSKKRPLREKHWSEDLDTTVRMSKRKETLGIPIGPATSSLCAEIILSKIDEKLGIQGFEFVRYIDDYTCLCKTHEEAQSFIRTLGNELSKFKLTLNLTKTSIIEQPEPLCPDWVIELNRAKPFSLGPNKRNTEFSISEVINFVDYAIRINQKTPDGSVLKFAFSSIINYIPSEHSESIAKYIINLSWHYPVLLPFLDKIEAPEGGSFYLISPLEEKINSILQEHSKDGRSDGVAWALYILIKNNLRIYKDSIYEVLKLKDPVSLAILSDYKPAEAAILDYACSLIKKTDFEKDQNWIFLYQLYSKDLIKKPYEDDETFRILKDYKVNFITWDNGITLAESYCEYLKFGYVFDSREETLSFKNWLSEQKE
ncbi:antiviral reverse transcriptase Drt4 [Larsenimonas salina]|uniref:antiviral reverse transcriptase Drt4 n=1 Tax=Larsenimonas salina TaxID=1295565 RepID=UPI00207435CE|nr:antiviral reverse transcriptase Drt4 [Larsenimonas salina]MCM5705113.1 RNA-directed DNA polymerase [Larsenimonas salina]